MNAKLTLVALGLFSVILVSAPAQTRVDEHGVRFSGKRYVTRVEVWREDLIRIKRWPLGAEEPADRSFSVIAKPECRSWSQTEDAGELRVQTPRLVLSLDKAGERVRFLDASGKLLSAELAEGTQFKPSNPGGKPALEVVQSFELPADEGIFGLGQHPDGKLNHRGTTVHLQQENRIVAVPQLVSSRGYGLLWDNPSITDVRVGGGEAGPIPQIAFIDEVGAPGLTARYYRTDSFTGLVATRMGSALELPWEKGLPVDIPRRGSSIRWSGFLVVGEGGDYQFMNTADNHLRVWIDGQPVLGQKTEDREPVQRAKLSLAQNSQHSLRIDYVQGEFDYLQPLSWELPAKPDSLSWTSEAGEAVDYYFMYGPRLDHVVAGYRKLTGEVPLLPRWAWGLWQCREHYETQEELLGVVRRYRELGIPLDGIIQDWQYWKSGDWGSHVLEPARYPDPAGMVDAVHKAGAHIIISVWPRFDLGLANTAELDKAGGLFPPVYQNVYPKGEGRWYDPYAPEGRRLYWKFLSRELFSKGFDGWWMDASEPELGGSWGQLRELQTGAGPGARVFNAYPLMHTTGVAEGQLAESQAKRVVILTRSAYPGQQRTGAITWSGDTRGSWKVFARQIPAGLNFSITGIPYWNTDIGGFFGGDPADPAYAELFTRWFQFGAFTPMFRIHGTGKHKAPWCWDATTQGILVDYDRLRYHLLPYVYSVSWGIHASAGTMLRPLVMDFREDRRVLDIPDQFLFGPALMASPVTQPGVQSREVYLPAGSAWIDFWTGERLEGGRSIKAEAPIQTMPLHVRAGTILPYGPAIQHAGEKPDDPVELRIYPGADGDFLLYEDEGDGLAYAKGVHAVIPLHWDESKGTLSVGARQGEYPGMPQERRFRVVLVGPGHGVGIEPSAKPEAELVYRGLPASLLLKPVKTLKDK